MFHLGVKDSMEVIRLTNLQKHSKRDLYKFKCTMPVYSSESTTTLTKER